MGDIRVIHADVYAALMHIPSRSIDVAVTSPPYWKQRDYGFKGQIGSESTYQEYIGKLLEVFSVLKDRLVDNGVFFLNIGDKYLSKYGNSPLLLIPYKLAYYMKENGWTLNDILIWYKPNHMPSSVRNRFSNTYEPIFVFSKSKSNYYTEYLIKNPNQPKVLKINLQPTPYNHIAVYPEKLVETLLSLTNLPPKATVLDPFAGSGTTGKAVINLNNTLWGKDLSCIMIEACDDYIPIISERCRVKKHNILSLPYLEYQTRDIEDEKLTWNDKYSFTYSSINEKGFVKIASTKNEYYGILDAMLNPEIKKKLLPTATIYLGCKDFDIDIIFKTSLLNDYGWVIRNVLINNNNGKIFPVFLIAIDNNKYEYIFNLDNIKMPHKTNTKINWKDKSIIGMKVINTISKTHRSGIVCAVVETYLDFSPKFVEVIWLDGTVTTEFVINEIEFSPKGTFLCRECGTELTHIFDPFHETECPNCHKKLWKDTCPFFKEDDIIKRLKGLKGDFGHNSLNEKVKEITTETKSYNSLFKRDYNGKFKYLPRVNWGASPGARSSLQEEYFSVKRLYNPPQAIVCEYLDFKRKMKGLSKTEITRMFSKEYTHTVGHWFRKDFGGSIPTPEDWLLLKNILDIDDDFTRYVCSTGLVLQTVKASKGGKNPGDYLEFDEENLVEFLKKTFII